MARAGWMDVKATQRTVGNARSTISKDTNESLEHMCGLDMIAQRQPHEQRWIVTERSRTSPYQLGGL